MKVCLVGSSGGHLTHLYMLKPFWQDQERFWVTFDKEDARSLLEGEQMIPCHFPTNRNLKNLIRKYSINAKSIGSQAIRDMLEAYYVGGDTGNKTLNNLIRVLDKQVLDEMAIEASKKASNSSKGTWQPKDTRIYFTVVLAYNEELNQAELARKGLDPNEKILLIEEVGEE